MEFNEKDYLNKRRKKKLKKKKSQKIFSLFPSKKIRLEFAL